MYGYRTHAHVMGTTQAGKSKLVEACCRAHIESGFGFTVLDWHGTLYRDLTEYLAYRDPRQKVVLLNPSSGSTGSTVPWNPFHFSGGDPAAFASHLVSLLAKVWGMENTNDMPNFRRIAQMLFTYVAVSGEPIQTAAMLLEYQNHGARQKALSILQDQPRARMEMEKLQIISAKDPTVSSLKEWEWNVGSTLNRLGKLLDSRALVRMFGVPSETSLDIDKAIDEKAIILVNLSASDDFDPDSAATLAALLLSEFQRVALLHAEEERPYFLYLDECQNYLTSDAARMLDQTAKAGLRLTLIHHHMGQFDDKKLIAALDMNAGIRFIFRMDDPLQATECAQELFMSELNQEWTRRERTRFVTDYDHEQFDTRDEHDSYSDGSTVYEEGASSNYSFSYGTTTHHVDRYVPRLKEISDNPEVWSRDEKLGQLAYRLMSLQSGCCYVKTPDGTCYHEVPYVLRHWTSSDTVLRFMKTANQLSLPADDADQIIRQQEQAFLERSRPDASLTKKRATKRPARLHPQE
jgi:hypothetical protein